MSLDKMNTIRVSDRDHAALMAILRYAESIGIATLVANNADLSDLISNGGLFKPLSNEEIGDLATRINCESVPLNDTRAHLVTQNPALYSGVEVHGVSNLAERDEDPVYGRNDVSPAYFVVNALLKAGGETRIGEFATREVADAFGQQVSTMVAPESLPNMPETVARRPLYDHEPDGYLEGDTDWAANNPEALRWFADNHQAIRARLAVLAPVVAKTGELKDFTVIGIVSDSGQIVADYVSAIDGMNAFAQAAQVRGSVEFVVAVPGHLSDGKDEIHYPGDSVVDVETVLEQPDVFGVPRPDAAEAERNGHGIGPEF